MCEGDNKPNLLDPGVREEIRQTVHAAMTEFMATMMGQAMAMRAGMGMPALRPAEGPAMQPPHLPAMPKPPAAPMQPPMAPAQPPATGAGERPVVSNAERSTEQLVRGNDKPTHGDVSLDFVIPNVLPLERPRKIGVRQFYFLNSTEPEPNKGDRANFVAPSASGIAQPQKTKSGCEFKPTPSA
ncbi:MAG: hypothetical protein H6839_02365 [Planctomycetes bacterium]|nr:hypothetical protein [Planctomycetota bacterium]